MGYVVYRERDLTQRLKGDSNKNGKNSFSVCPQQNENKLTVTDFIFRQDGVCCLQLRTQAFRYARLPMTSEEVVFIYTGSYMRLALFFSDCLVNSEHSGKEKKRNVR